MRQNKKIQMNNQVTHKALIRIVKQIVIIQILMFQVKKLIQNQVDFLIMNEISF